MNIVRSLAQTQRHEYSQSSTPSLTQTCNYTMNVACTLSIHSMWILHTTRTTKGERMLGWCNSNSMFSDTEVTPAVHGCHGNFIWWSLKAMWLTLYVNPLLPTRKRRTFMWLWKQQQKKWRFCTMLMHCIIIPGKSPEFKHWYLGLVWFKTNLLYSGSSHTSWQWSPNKIQWWKCRYSL